MALGFKIGNKLDPIPKIVYIVQNGIIQSGITFSGGARVTQLADAIQIYRPSGGATSVNIVPQIDLSKYNYLKCDMALRGGTGAHGQIPQLIVAANGISRGVNGPTGYARVTVAIDLSQLPIRNASTITLNVAVDDGAFDVFSLWYEK